ncbi:MAG: hypothetical protein R3C68_05435 [Myxococcota bacterium]
MLSENDQLVEVYIERAAERGVVGNIYRGKVVRVLPGMQAAFAEVDLGGRDFFMSTMPSYLIRMT